MDQCDPQSGAAFALQLIDDVSSAVFDDFFGIAKISLYFASDLLSFAFGFKPIVFDKMACNFFDFARSLIQTASDLISVHSETPDKTRRATARAHLLNVGRR